MIEWMQREIVAAQRGLAPHYLLVYSAVLGLQAAAVFEFGAGRSTRVLLQALSQTGGQLFTCSTDPQAVVIESSKILSRDLGPRWEHFTGLSEQLPDSKLFTHLPPYFDLVLHDGSHTGSVVAADLKLIAPRIKQYGLLLVHDTEHSVVGREMQAAIRSGLEGIPFSSVTLPYGFGLTICRIEGEAFESVQPSRPKRTSLHQSVPGLR